MGGLPEKRSGRPNRCLLPTSALRYCGAWLLLWVSPIQAQNADLIPTVISTGSVSVRLTQVADGLTAPNFGVTAPNDSNSLFIVDQDGEIFRLNLTTGILELFLDMTPRVSFGGERGLFGLAFHPGYAFNGLFYSYHSEAVAGTADFSTIPMGSTANHQSVILEWQVINPANAASKPGVTPRELLRIDQPQGNHNAGAILFDAVGFLYIALGDGGSADDQGEGHGTIGNGQDITNPLGAILRIDPLGNNSANGRYGVPGNNPFIGLPGLDEIFAYGFRNPFRMTRDSFTGAIWLSDVGQEDIEEVDVLQQGGNYGWNLKEGSFFFDTNGTGLGFATTTDPGGLPPTLLNPVAEYDHDEGNAIIGGFVYRGRNFGTSFQGNYVFGDLSGNGGNGRLLFYTGTTILEFAGDQVQGLILGFGQDAQGELYVMTGGNSGGAVNKLENGNSTASNMDNSEIVNVGGGGRGSMSIWSVIMLLWLIALQIPLRKHD